MALIDGLMLGIMDREKYSNITCRRIIKKLSEQVCLHCLEDAKQDNLCFEHLGLNPT